MLDRFQHNSYVIRRKVFKLMGGAFHVFDAEGNVIFYSKQKAFKLKEDIRLYTSEDMSEEILLIKARNVVDFSAAYDVIDSTNNQIVGTFKRRGWKSIARDHWMIFDAEGNEVGHIIEDNPWLAFLRRFITSLIPQSFAAEVAGNRMCTLHQQFNPFVYKLEVNFPIGSNAFERIMGIAGGILIAAIEGRQGN